MGVDIRSPHFNVSMSYGGFYRLRIRIATLISEDWRKHYYDEAEEIRLGLYDSDGQQGDPWAEYNAKTERMANELPEKVWPVVDFLYKSDCEGELGADECGALALFLMEHRSEWIDETATYAYALHPPFALYHFYVMVMDGADTGEGISWI